MKRTTPATQVAWSSHIAMRDKNAKARGTDPRASRFFSGATER
jgi:hypothetical protein